MGRSLGFTTISFLGLKQFFDNLSDEPTTVRMTAFAYGYRNVLRADNATLAGFKVQFAPRGNDDYIIIKGLNACTAANTREIVLVSSDSDFIPAITGCLQRNIKVTWVAAAEARGGDGNPMLGVETRRFLRRNSTMIRFVDVSNVAPQLFYAAKKQVRSA
jgi:hypothetical protein